MRYAGRMKRLRILPALAFLLALTTVWPLCTSAAADESKYIYHIVSLGDSITAGFEPEMITNSSLVPYGFTDRLKEQGFFHGRTELANYGILGLKSDGLKRYVAAIQEGSKTTPENIQSGLPDPRMADIASGIPKAKADLKAADVITITIGGNDVQPIMEEAAKLPDADLEAKVKSMLDAYTANLKSVLNDLRVLNPDALIVVADQYQPVPEIAGAMGYAKLGKAAKAFTAAIDAVVEERQGDHGLLKVAHVAEVFVGHELAYTHILDKDIHPKQAGYEAMAKVFTQVIFGDYRETEASVGQAPISIVVNGHELKTVNKPVLKNGQTFIAIGDILQAIGATSKWDSKKAAATITYGTRKVVIAIGAKTIQVDGAAVATAAPAFLNKVGKESKTYVPLALLAKGLGLDVQYSTKLKTAFINP
ncbi:stalk domain-containing protein [Paenibacillus sp. CAA11]|uniref:stalk domain-containing protein n=1 Tax=Paenibacillus sp. CAA11 TaxID=1532905 RepID=UPI00131EDD5D|nr:stalk domain-containing protein [Paenibacillus sp. CAA11]